jgi:hypothetical protein
VVFLSALLETKGSERREDSTGRRRSIDRALSHGVLSLWSAVVTCQVAIDTYLLLPSMKQKRASYKRFKLVSHEVSNEPRPDSHVEVHTGSRGRLGSHTIYRRRPATSSPLGSDTEELPHKPVTPSTSLDTSIDHHIPIPSSNEKRPANVSDFQL